MLRVSTAAQQCPGSLALQFEGRSITFGELQQRVLRLTEQLIASGSTERNQAGGGRPLAFLADNDLETLCLLYCLLELQIPALPINPRLTEGEIERLVASAGARRLDRHDGGWMGRSAVAAPPLGADPRTEHATWLVATSGTSGTPKLVALHEPVLIAAAQASARRLGWRDEDRWLLSLGLSHISGLSIVSRCLLARRPVVVPAVGSSGAGLRELCERHRVTLLSLVPTQLEQLLALGPPPANLRVILLGGARARAGLVKRAREAGWPVLLTYGMTEAASALTLQPLSDLDRTKGPPGQDAGLPLDGVELQIVDGTLWARGPSLFRGYAGCSRPDRTPLDWFDTGDRGSLTEEGRFVPAGRRDDRIVTGGENVDPVEVERVLEQCLDPADLCVVGLPDDTWGEVVAVAWVPRYQSDDPVRVGRWIVEQTEPLLAPFKRPRLLCVLPRLPRTDAGKLDRRQLRAVQGWTRIPWPVHGRPTS